jgi:iron complex outermembrane recepter protein
MTWVENRPESDNKKGDDMQRLMRTRGLLHFAVALSLVFALAPAHAGTATFSIDPQDLAGALKAFAVQSHREIFFAPELARGRQSRGVKGQFDDLKALDIILQGTGLNYSVTPSNAILVRDPAGKPTSQAAAAVPDDANSSKEAGKKTSQDFRVAHVDQGKGTTDVPLDKSNAQANKKRNEGLEEIVVTGSRLRDTQPTSHVVVITAEDIAREGASTAADIIRQLPQNVSTVNLGTSTTSLGASNDIPTGALGVATANLRGLGTDATLVLVNGRRIASSPSFNGAGQVNLGTIPAAAIERVEVLLDGASAIYGSDAIGGVINFILRKDYEGAETRVRYDDGANGGDAWTLTQTLGTGWETGHVLVTAQYHDMQAVNAYRAGWTSSDLTSRGGSDWRRTAVNPAYIFDLGGSLPASFNGTEQWTAADVSPNNVVPYDIAATRLVDATPKGYLGSLTLSLEQQLGSRVTGFVDALYSKSKNVARDGVLAGQFTVPASNPFNRLGTAVFVQDEIQGVDDVNETQIQRLNVSAGVDVRLFADWKLNATGTFGSEESQNYTTTVDPSIANTINLFGNGTAQGNVSPFVSFPLGDDPKSFMRTLDMSVDGRLFALPGGDAKLAAGLQYHPETLDLSASPGENGYYLPISNNLKLVSRAYFFEAGLPLVGVKNEVPGIQSLLLRVAGRYDDYTFKGQFLGPSSPEETREFTKFNPEIGLLWHPIEQLALRASWDESFKAPGLLDLGQGFTLYPAAIFGTFPVRDPVTGKIIQVQQAVGGNPNLKPETSTSYSYGIVWTPPVVPGLSLDVTFTRIDYTNRIEQEYAGDPTIWPYLAELPALIPRDLPVSAGGDGNPTTIDAAVAAPINLAKRTVHVVDFTASQSFNTEFGRFRAEAAVVRTLQAYDQVLPGAPAIQLVGTELGPDRTVARGNLGWDRGHFGANLFVHFSSSYRNTYTNSPSELTYGSAGTSPQALPQTQVASYTTFDLTGFYKSDHGFQVSAGAINLSNHSFPFFDSFSSSYDAQRVDPHGRTVYVELSQAFGKH